MQVVTGATGHLGNALLRLLSERGEKVRAMVLPQEKADVLSGIANIEIVRGNVCDLDSLQKAFKGADTVFHLASVISISKGERPMLEAVNVQGTRNVIQACRDNHVGRLVYTSSVHAFSRLKKGEIVTEETPIDPRTVLGDYGQTKAEATLAVLDSVKQGLDAVIVHPSAIIGPYDIRPSKLGKMILNVATGKLRANINGAYNFVDVRDVALGEILAAEKGISGHNYILCGVRKTLGEFFGMVAETAGRHWNNFVFPDFMVRIASHFADFFYKISRKEPLFTSEAIEILHTNTYIRSTRATRELGFKPRSLEQTIHDTVNWFHSINAC